MPARYGRHEWAVFVVAGLSLLAWACGVFDDSSTSALMAGVVAK